MVTGHDAIDDEMNELLKILREARQKARGYAGFFQWPDRAREELGVAQELAKTLERQQKNFMYSVKTRGRGYDPPDCEALDSHANKIALEISELVDENAIRAAVRNLRSEPEERLAQEVVWADWGLQKFSDAVTRLLVAKDRRFDSLKGGPFIGGYVVVLYSDEPALHRSVVEQYLEVTTFTPVIHISRAFLLLSYDPEFEGYPAFELKLSPDL